jgi:mevalonate kinase
MERLQHGKPSGCDAACIISGGTISYQLKQPPETTLIKQLGKGVDKLKMFIIYTGKQRDTKKLVNLVSKFREEKPDDFQELIRVISDVSSELIELV